MVAANGLCACPFPLGYLDLDSYETVLNLIKIVRPNVTAAFGKVLLNVKCASFGSLI